MSAIPLRLDRIRGEEAAMRQGKKPNRCPYCGRPCAERACSQHRDLLKAELEVQRGRVA